MPNPVNQRSPEQTAISVSITKEHLERVDARASSLGLSRSRYITVVTQQDINKGGPLIIAAQDAAAPVVPVELTTEALDFLKVAIPALTQYQDSHGQCPTPEVPAEIAETELWPYFLKQQDQILKDKWIESSNAGYDIGMERAIRGWLQKNQILWAPEDVEDEETEESNGTNTAGTAPTTNPA
jgi:hypothetical protein